MSACSICGSDKDCRPYGDRGEAVCFSCAFATPSAKRATEAAFGAQLDACGPAAVAGGESGPYPYFKDKLQ